MPDRTSALYVSRELADRAAWRITVLNRIEQVAQLDVHATMARLDDKVLYLVEGDAAAVAAFLNLLSTGHDDPDARALIGPTMARWDARPGRLMTPVLSDDEMTWLSRRVTRLSRDGRDIQACLRWASMRTRETAFLDFGRGTASPNDSFPPTIAKPFQVVPLHAPASLDFIAE